MDSGRAAGRAVFIHRSRWDSGKGFHFRADGYRLFFGPVEQVGYGGWDFYTGVGFDWSWCGSADCADEGDEVTGLLFGLICRHRVCAVKCAVEVYSAQIRCYTISDLGFHFFHLAEWRKRDIPTLNGRNVPILDFWLNIVDSRNDAAGHVAISHSLKPHRTRESSRSFVDWLTTCHRIALVPMIIAQTARIQSQRSFA